jgi:hypothetical protein
LVFALIGGALIKGGIQLALSSTAFRTWKADQVKLTVDSVFNLSATGRDRPKRAVVSHR